MQDQEQSIRERAYQLWIEGGSLEGHADAHWLSAQREILSTSLSHLGSTTITEPPVTAPKSRTKASRKKKLAA